MLYDFNVFSNACVRI